MNPPTKPLPSVKPSARQPTIRLVASPPSQEPTSPPA
jgi:hypothetical protein